MYYNDQDCHHLLIWINQQISRHSPLGKVYTFNQIHQSKVLIKMLNHIHATFFQDLNDSAYDFHNYVAKIQEYLQEYQDLIFKKSYKQSLHYLEQAQQIVKLILYISLKGNCKQETINKILQLQSQTQQYLMNQLQKMQKNLQYKTKIKEIVSIIQSLQKQSEFLCKRLQQQNNTFDQIVISNKAKIQNYEKYQDLDKFNVQEKTAIFELLKIQSNRSYLQIYKDLQKQNNHLKQQFHSLQFFIKMKEEEIQEDQDKLAEEDKIIQYLDEQIKKHTSSQDKENFVAERVESFTINANEKWCSKSAKHNYSRLQRSFNGYLSIFGETSFDNSFQLEMIENVLPFPPLEINQEIDQYQKEISIMDKQIAQLKHGNYKQAKNLIFNRQTLRLLKSQYNQFHLNYEYLISA